MIHDAIRVACERCAKAVSLRPALGRGTGVSRTRIRHGLTCAIEEGPWTLPADMPVQLGGGGSAPTPGVYGRAALGSCLAVGYMLYAAKHRVPFAAIEVEIQTDYDDAGLLGVGDAAPDYHEVRYTVSVESAAPDADVRRVLDEAERHSPYLHVFTRPQACRRIVHVIAPRES